MFYYLIHVYYYVRWIFLNLLLSLLDLFIYFKHFIHAYTHIIYHLHICIQKKIVFIHRYVIEKITRFCSLVEYKMIDSIVVSLGTLQSFRKYIKEHDLYSKHGYFHDRNKFLWPKRMANTSMVEVDDKMQLHEKGWTPSQSWPFIKIVSRRKYWSSLPLYVNKK